MSDLETNTQNIDIRRTDSIVSLSRYAPFFAKRIPQSMVWFVVALLSRLQSIIGFNFLIEVPAIFESKDLSAAGILKKLAYLKEKGMFESYHEVHSYYHDEPKLFAARVNLTGVDTNKRVGLMGYGRSFHSQEEAWGPAYGEGVERWCIEYFNPPEHERKILTTSQLRDDTGLDLLKAPGIAPSFRENPRFPSHLHISKRYDIAEDSKFVCVKTTELVTKRELFVPLQFFSFDHTRRYLMRQKESVIYPAVSTGAAAGRTRDEATLGALLESIERDASMIYWLRKIVPKRIDARSLNTPFGARVREIEDRYHLKAHFLHLPTDFPTHTIACVLVDETGSVALTADTTSHWDAEIAMEKVFLHTLAFRPAIRFRYHDMTESEPLTFGDTHDLTHKTRVLWWYLKENLQHVEFFISGEYIPCPKAYTFKNEREYIDTIVQHCAKREYPVYCQNIMPPDLEKELDLFVVWTKIPQLQPMHLDEYERGTVGERLEKIPIELGLTPTTAANTTPHPFS